MTDSTTNLNQGLARFWQLGPEGNTQLHSAMETCLKSINEYFTHPQAAKTNLMKTDMRVAVNVLNTFAKLRQAESGMIQALAVLGERQVKSEDFKAFIEQHIPHLAVKKLKAPEKK